MKNYGLRNQSTTFNNEALSSGEPKAMFSNLARGPESKIRSSSRTLSKSCLSSCRVAWLPKFYLSAVFGLQHTYAPVKCSLPSQKWVSENTNNTTNTYNNSSNNTFNNTNNNTNKNTKKTPMSFLCACLCISEFVYKHVFIYLYIFITKHVYIYIFIFW